MRIGDRPDPDAMTVSQFTERGRYLTTLALLVTAVVGVAGTALHLESIEHTYCPEHRKFTHAQEHPRHELDREGARSTVDSPSDQTPDDRDGEGCRWVDWFHSDDTPTVDLDSSPSLPSPTATHSPAIEATDGFPVERPVDRRHVSPINSPPAV